ncbi:hypothetical protein [Vagococcus acidifermentans]|uniref:Uncharacterized protein n=1 Tax=Vagococcus acidifermentans TaxID=564710 RepID=A0A430APG3_9ENTE|nr:hypothetical protein [Vagococcus acidifermentans]RSU09946.1 hypothetical protein CBF27_11655 [Vagococcus acidifermentans]
MILSGTIYTTVGLLILLSAFLWHYFLWHWYEPLIAFSMLFILIGLLFYTIAYLQFKGAVKHPSNSKKCE